MSQYPHVTLSRAQALELIAFAIQNQQLHYFIAKDHGAYVGITNRSDERIIHYFPGCNPKTDADYCDNCRMEFGGDDFGELLSCNELEKMLMDKTVIAVRWEVTPREIRITTTSRKNMK